jgi:glycosyltransferase involved in cell wall biosynthesis
LLTLPTSINNVSSLRRQLQIPENKLVVIFVGQLVKGKGIFDLAKAFAILRKKVTPDKMPYLYFIGTPASNEVIASLSNNIKEDDIESFVNIIPQQNKIYKWMQASDILVLPSHEGTEGMGRVLFEAMACGSATIGTDTSGVREAISEESGFLVQEKAAHEIAEKIELLINDPELLSKKKKYGRKRALQLFDIKKHASNVEKFYYDILNI